MSSLSPGDVKMLGDAEDGPGAAAGDARAFAPAETSPVRAPAQKRARDSPATTPARTRALAVIGNITDTFRASAVCGLRAITDSIEKPRDDTASTGSTDSGPPSPTTAVRAATATPKGKKRRTALTDALTRRSHADWRGAQWDYTSAMRDKNLHRVGDMGPSIFAFPDGRPIAGDGLGGAQLVQEGDTDDEEPRRPPSAMSAASAPAVMLTPTSRPRQGSSSASPKEGLDDRGWIVSVTRPDFDPFAIPAGVPADQMDADVLPEIGETPHERGEAFVRAIREATALLSHDTVNSPDACGALLAFQAQLRAHDPYGNFAPSPPASGTAAAEMRELRMMVEGLAEAQKACTDALRALAARSGVRGTSTGTPGAQRRGDAPATVTDCTGAAHGCPPEGVKPPPTVTDAPSAPPTQKLPRNAPATGAPTGADRSAPGPAAKSVGRHDPRRAVFRPAKPFGGRIAAPASPEAVRDLNAASYVVRDAVNAALRDVTVAQMDEAAVPVQVTGVNWTERGNLCMVVAEGFVAAHLLLHADVAAEAAALGAGWKASRDVPIFKAVLCNVPTHRVDGTLFTEDDVLGDLRAHSMSFRSIQLADSAEQAGWIATDSERARKKRSTMVLNLATAGDMQRFLAMRRCLYVLGCACEPGEFQPKDRERICRTCWNPLARHRERDFRCRTRCRLCGEPHAEEDHTCHVCNVLARACVHIPLKCVNCGRAHAADDGACEYRRRLRGSSASAPPMSSRKDGRAGKGSTPAPAPEKGKKRRRVRVLEPDEPFPDDPPPGPDPVPAPSPAPDAPARVPSADATGGAASPKTKKKAKRAKSRAAPGVSPTAPDAATTPPRDAPEPAETPALQAAPAREGEGSSSPASDAGDFAPPADLTAEDELAVQDLVGEPAPPVQTGTSPAHVEETAALVRRAAPSRAAAAEADRDGRRRRVAHVLAGAFSFLRVPDAVAALRKWSDDHASVVSWAAEEQASRRKPGMHNKTADSLRKLVADMDTAAANYKPKKATDPVPPSVDA